MSAILKRPIAFKPGLRIFRAVSILALVSLVPVVRAEPERGVFGVTVAITGTGWLNPTIRVAKVTQVQPGLPAYRSGVSSGDEVLELDGKRIRGAKAADLAPLAQGKRVGEKLTVLLQRPNGAAYTVVLVAESPSK